MLYVCYAMQYVQIPKMVGKKRKVIDGNDVDINGISLMRVNVYEDGE